MSLCIDDGTKQEVLNLFTVPGGYNPGYIRIFRCDIDYTGNSFTATLKLYSNKEARDNDPFSGHTIEIGGNIPESAIEKMKAVDNRDILYKYIEALIQVQNLDKTMPINKAEMTPEEIEKIIQEKNLKIKEIYTTLGIDQ